MKIHVANNVPVDKLLITEGSLLPVKPEDLTTIDARFLPSARFATPAQALPSWLPGTGGIAPEVVRTRSGELAATLDSINAT